MGEAAEELVAAEMMDDRFGDDRAEAGHPLAKPFRDLAAVEGKICAAGSLGHGPNTSSRTKREQTAAHRQ